MPAVPRKAIEIFVERVIAPFKTDPVIGGLKPGPAFQMVKEVVEPKTLSMANRIPHILNTETGDMVSGRPGIFHNTVLEEGVLEGKFKKGIERNLSFIIETPISVEFEGVGYKTSDEV